MNSSREPQSLESEEPEKEFGTIRMARKGKATKGAISKYAPKLPSNPWLTSKLCKTWRQDLMEA